MKDLENMSINKIKRDNNQIVYRCVTTEKSK